MKPSEAYTEIIELFNSANRSDHNIFRNFQNFIDSPEYKKEIEKLKKIILKDPIQTANFGSYYGKRCEEAEEVIKTNPKAISYYVENVRHCFEERWTEAETTLLQGSPIDVFNYYTAFVRSYSIQPVNKHFPNKTWIEAEPILSKKMSLFHQYVIITEKPNKLYEQEILNNPDYKFNPKYIYEYSSKILNDRWKQAEPIILKHPDYAAKYCTKFELPVPEEIHNQIIAEVALSNKSTTFRKRFLQDENKRKKKMIEYLKELVSTNKISKETTVEELINNI